LALGKLGVPEAKARVLAGKRASETSLSTALLEFFSARLTSLQLSPACKCGRNVSRIRGMVNLLFGIGSDRKERWA